MARPMTFVVGLLALGAIPFSVVRSPAGGERDGGSQARHASADKPRAPELERLDLSYLAPDATEALAFRPAALFRRPALANIRGHLQYEIEGTLKWLNAKGHSRLPLEEIEQITLQVSIHRDAREKRHLPGFGLSLASIRCVSDFDWKGQMRELFPDATEVSHAGGAYFRCALPANVRFPRATDLTWWVPDGRTIVFNTESNLRRLMERKGRQAESQPWADGWQRVDRGLVALAINNRDGHLIETEDEAINAICAPIDEQVAWVTAGGGADGGIQAIAGCKSEKGAQQIIRTLRTLLGSARLALAQQSSVGPPASSEYPAQELLAESFLSSASVTREGNRILFHADSKGHLEAALKEGVTKAEEAPKAIWIHSPKP